MTIRDKVKIDLEDLLSVGWCADYLIDTHINRNYFGLQVNKAGKLFYFEEPSTMSYTPNMYNLLSCYNSCSCNCDRCLEWKENKDNMQDDYDCNIEYFLRETILENSGEILDLVDTAFAVLNDIPIGFFDDEEKDD